MFKKGQERIQEQKRKGTIVDRASYLTALAKFQAKTFLLSPVVGSDSVSDEHFFVPVAENFYPPLSASTGCCDVILELSRQKCVSSNTKNITAKAKQ